MKRTGRKRTGRKKRFNRTVARTEMRKAWKNAKGKKPSKKALSAAMKKAWK